MLYFSLADILFFIAGCFVGAILMSAVSVSGRDKNE